MVDSFRDLDVWQKALDLAELVYRLSARFPPPEQFGLRAQMRRAAVSVSSNIAEGTGRFSTRDYARHVSIARGSVAEIESQLEVAVRLGYVDREAIAPTLALADEISRMLRSLRLRLLAKLTESAVRS